MTSARLIAMTTIGKSGALKNRPNGYAAKQEIANNVAPEITATVFNCDI